MLLPDETPRCYTSRNEELEAWAKLESKSECMEHDLLESHRPRERISWKSVFAFALHCAHAILSGKTFER